MKRFHYDKETGLGYLIKNNDIDGKPTIKIVFKVKKETSTKFEKISESQSLLNWNLKLGT